MHALAAKQQETAGKHENYVIFRFVDPNYDLSTDEGPDGFQSTPGGL